MSAAPVRLDIDGVAVEVPAGASVAAAVALAAPHFRRSRSGQPRAPLCGMGVCFECRVRIDGVEHQRSCLVPAREGMRVACDD
ncbi:MULTISPECIES: 2Fe-2S iron-sulfur cluster-binding protein [Lysobacter]|jgi:sarcosine oxidase subunit alpha|uniref:Ferredoxin n=2 Tax=Lysobacter TaxID=68 RepID=A0A0S2DNS1_LYSEN|nr:MULTISPECIES: 2Fe-2S iron-sulfur cluster-binding protein [Lysobacter]ALN59951.1 ferredoxin [Lysobacter enzymogenes]QQQ02032.1 (2Fe-2S)-binding protein [Lysobacter enzymogenes]UZW61308.1 (2Fe-2S)-binding protein [Lysobacter enzymogenes]WMT05181.1 2Fe-2S iron-sulfur cluster-binding protein [Lysobacter yananisis]